MTEHSGSTTGDPRVDAAVSRLADLDQRAVHEHVEVYDDIHRQLRDVLADAGDAGDAGDSGDAGEASSAAAESAGPARAG